MKRLFIDGRRTGYAPSQCGRTMTVGELIEYLQDGVGYDFKEDTPVMLRNDNGYTYGEISYSSFSLLDDDDDDDEEDEEENEE